MRKFKVSLDCYILPFGVVALGVSFHSGSFYRIALRADCLFFTVVLYFQDAMIDINEGIEL